MSFIISNAVSSIIAAIVQTDANINHNSIDNITLQWHEIRFEYYVYGINNSFEHTKRKRKKYRQTGMYNYTAY